MTVTMPRTAAVALKILWADDDAKDLKGRVNYLRYLGHTVLTTTDFDSTAAALEAEIFDLLIVDQQMPKEGRKSYSAGTMLVTMLAQGELGEMNRELPFLFVTASDEWVLENELDVDVEGLDAFVAIEEKGDDLTTFVVEHIEHIERRSPMVDAGRCEPEAVASPAREEIGAAEPALNDEAPTPAVTLSEEWHGLVSEVGDGSFRARLTAATVGLPDHEVCLPHGAVAEDEQPLIVEGASFVWSVRVRDEDSGERVTISRIRFAAMRELSREDVQRALRRAADRAGPSIDA